MTTQAELDRMPPDAVLTRQEAALLLRLSRATVSRLATSGELPGKQIGPMKQWRFIKSELLAWLGKPRPA